MAVARTSPASPTERSMMPPATRPLAVVTGASAGIGYQLALCAARGGYDLVVASDEDTIAGVADDFRRAGAEHVESVRADLATTDGNDQLVAAVEKTGRPVEALLANAGRGLGQAFLDQDWSDIDKLLDTNIVGTVYLVHRIGRAMKTRGAGKILLTGSIAGHMAGSYQAVYNGSKSFVNLFGEGLRDELKDSGVTVTVLKPGVTDTNFFDTGGLEPGTPVGDSKKDDPAEVAKTGFDAMEKGEASVTYAVKNKLAEAIATVLPDSVVAAAHRKMSEPKS